MKLKQIESYVITALKYSQIAREDDFVLYGMVIKQMGVDLSQPVSTFLANAKKLKRPPFESVSRCRRKVQEKYPELIDTTTFAYRNDMTTDYKGYSRS